MATPNRSSLLARLHKTLKKHYKPVAAPGRALLEHLLYASCLENASYESAETAYAAVSTSFFDWNEVRVSSVKELAEAMRALPEPEVAADRLKRTLQSAFEATYSFDLESFKKQNLGQAVQRLAKFDGTTPFTIGYVTQAALGGHAIPLDRGALEVLFIVGAASEAEVKAAEVAGVERAIPKNKGVEFGSLLHQLGAELVAAPFSPAVHKTLLEITTDAKDRFPKRQTKKPVPPPPVAPSKHPVAAATAKKSAVPDKKKQVDDKKKPAAKSEPAKKPVPAAKKKGEVVKLAKRKPR